jgi:urease accessory protein UreH
LGLIEEDEEEDQDSELYDSKVQIQTKGKSVYAERFDFRLNNQYFINNIKIDDGGARINALTTLQGRVVSSSAISLNENGANDPKSKKDTSSNSKSKYYF